MSPIVTYFRRDLWPSDARFDLKRAQKHILLERRGGQSRLGGVARGGAGPGGPRAGAGADDPAGHGAGGHPGHRDGGLIAAATTLKKLSLKCQIFPTPSSTCG